PPAGGGGRLVLAFRECRKRSRLPLARDGCLGQGVDALDETTRHARRQHGVARVHGPHGRHELVAAGVLQEESARAGLQRTECIVVEVKRREDEHLDLRRVARDPRGGLDAADARHPDVHEHEVGAQLERAPDGVLTVDGFSDDREVGFGVEDQSEAEAAELLVVGEEDADRDGHAGWDSFGGVWQGRVAVSSHRPAPAGPDCTDPPRWATRSARPRRPKPAGWDALRGKSAPSLAISTVTSSTPWSTRTRISRADGAWRMAFVTPSCTTRPRANRTAVGASPFPVTLSVTGKPARCAASTASRGSTGSIGVSSASPLSSARRTPSIMRISS